MLDFHLTEFSTEYGGSKNIRNVFFLFFFIFVPELNSVCCQITNAFKTVFLEKHFASAYVIFVGFFFFFSLLRFV